MLLCGDCHTLIHGGNEQARRRIGVALADRPATIRYMIEQLGREPAKAYLRRRYFYKGKGGRPVAVESRT